MTGVSGMSSPVVSVVIPTYNRVHLVGRAIQSVLAQTFHDWELIMVDDASTDNTEDVVRSFADRRLRYIRREKNGGVSAAQNLGIAAARGEYISFLHSDDEYLPTKLKEQVVLLRGQDPQVGAAECGVRRVDDDHEYTTLPRLQGLGYEDLLLLEKSVYIAALLMRRELAESIRFDEAFPGHEDVDFLLSLLQRSKVAFIQKPLVVVHGHAGPRLSAPAVMLEGIQQLGRKYSAELKKRPHVEPLALPDGPLSGKAG